MDELTNIVAGFMAGLLCALGGALKDCRYEGFKPLTFVRSIWVGILWGVVSIKITGNPLLAFVFCGYMERATVEGWKIVRDRKPGKFSE